MEKDVAYILYSKKTIQKRVRELGKQLRADYEGKDLLVVSTLKGSVVFFSDLMRAMDFPFDIDFVSCSSYGSGTVSRELVFKKNIDSRIEGRDVLIVEDIVDSGNTLKALKERIISGNPNSVKLCSLLDKKARREVDIDIDYVGFVCANEFVIGYGLDYNEKYRNLPYIGVLKRDVYE
ncbi:MAG: hypoxanthine phosphoribosyltransferase [Clostridia bacterium]|nr:hypoxanthine phosphoribosyltransferase [Clostridia bacterium]